MHDDITPITRTRQGMVGGTGIVLNTPLDLPEGTEVVVDVRIARQRDSGAAGDEKHEVQTSLTPEQLHAWALAHPAPQSWWDETDNPFEPEQSQDPATGAEERPQSR